MSDLARRKRRTVVSTLMMLAGMGMLVYYAVPLYNLFCRVTGYGGTTQRAAAAPGAVGDRVIIVRFTADTNAGLPWYFQPAQTEVRVRAGEQKLIFYVAKNRDDVPVTGTATFNVTPAKAGVYFNKVQCFCFTKQTLKPGQQVDMPVSFFIDPKMLKDRGMNDVKVITLSYTFFRAYEPGKHTARQTERKTQAN